MSKNSAFVNKGSLELLVNGTQVSLDYLARKTQKDTDVVAEWCDAESAELPTINQAKMLARALRIPFACLYMNPEHISIPELPNLRNMRTLHGTTYWDNSELNLSLVELLSARKLLIEVSEVLGIELPALVLSTDSSQPSTLAERIRETIGISLESQYKCASKRQFYLLLKRKIEECGIFVQCFRGAPLELVRGVALPDFPALPIIGINDKDHYPAKSFSLIHELVHIIRSSPAVCNDMSNSFPQLTEEVYCNAVAGEFLVPEKELQSIYAELSHSGVAVELIEKIADKFCVSKEVVIRRMLDVSPPIVSQDEYVYFMDKFTDLMRREREIAKEKEKKTGKPSFFRKPSQEAVDRTSVSLSQCFLRGYEQRYFSRQDVGGYLGIGQTHVKKYLTEVARWTN